jgi:hypothetical protein
MIGFVVFAVIVGALVALAVAADRWGVDSRTMTSDGRAMSLFSR